MTEFNKGDRVRRIGGYNYGLVKDEIYIIEQFIPDIVNPLVVVKGHSDYYLASWFELVDTDYKKKFEEAEKVLREEGKKRGWSKEYDGILERAGFGKPKTEFIEGKHYKDQNGEFYFCVREADTKLWLWNLSTPRLYPVDFWQTNTQKKFKPLKTSDGLTHI